MTLADFLATWRGLTLENRLHRLAVLGLIGTNLITAVALPPVPRTLLLAANDAPATIRHVSAASSDNDTSDKGGTPAA